MPKLKLLIIDNDKDLLKKLKSYIKKNMTNVDIFVTSTSEQAFKLTNDFSFDAIISEYKIETLDALKFLKLIRKNSFENPFILFTTNGDKRIIIKALNEGILGYIEKGKEPQKKFSKLIKIINQIAKNKIKKQKIIEIENELQKSELKLFDELHEKDIFLKQLIEKSPFGIYLYDMDSNNNLIFKSANPYADRLMNLDHSIFIGKKILEVFPNLKDTDIPDEYRKIAKKGGIWETVHFTYQDEKISGVFEVKAFQIKPGSVFVMFDDITTRKVGEIQKQKYIDNLTFLSETSIQLTGMRLKENVFDFIGSCLHNLIGDSVVVVSSYNETLKKFRAENIIGINKNLQKITKILGKNPNDIQIDINTDCLMLDNIGKLNLLECGISELTNQKISEKQSKLIWRLMKLGKIYTLASADDGKLYGNILIVLKDNVESIPNPELIEAFVGQAAITLFRIEKEEALLEREYLFTELVKNMNDGLGIDNKNGEFTYVNEMLCEMLNYSSEELLNRKIEEFLDDTNKTIYRNQMRNRKYKIANRYEISWKRKDGTSILTSIKPRPLFDKNGDFIGSFAVITDITERKKAENDLRLSKEELQIQKDELESFASTVSHDIRGRLQIISSLVDMHESEYTNMIIEEIDELTHFINNLLFLARKGSILGEFSKINLGELIRKITSKLSSVNSSLLFTIDDLPTINGDPIKLNQVFENILINILKHANASIVVISSKTTKSHHKIIIKDDGVGITEEKLKEIRRSWKTRKYKSFGMLIALKIVEAHEGTIEMNSIKNEGTTVTISIPRL